MNLLSSCNPNELFHMDPSVFLFWSSKVLKVKFCLLLLFSFFFFILHNLELGVRL